MFYSHPHRPLVKHLTEVEEYARNQVPKDLIEVNKVICYCHDFGKYTTFFQKYLFDHKRSEVTNHGFISALLGAYAAFKMFNQRYMPLIVYSVILHHHGSLENISEDLPRSFRGLDYSTDDVHFLDKVEAAFKQVDDMKCNVQEIVKDYTALDLNDVVIEFLNDENSITDTLNRLIKIYKSFDRKNQSAEFYFLHQTMYSALISADKVSASGVKVSEIQFADYDIMYKAKQEKLMSSNVSELNKIRQQIFDNVNQNIEADYNKTSIFSITAPTGTGKTYTGFFAALKLRELLGQNNKIIYALPFTSIIDQNYDVIYKLMNNIDEFEKKSSTYIIKHHSLVNVDYKSLEEQYSKAQSELLIENWNSGIIVTTFVQLLQTLISNRNRMLKKFACIRNSIILLDEVQAIDIAYFKLVDFVLREAAKELNCKVILMTATKPIILQDGTELLNNNKKYFSAFNRTRLKIDLTRITIDDFIAEFVDNIEEKSYLIVCNTISQSLDIYNNLKGLCTDRQIIYLSTNILPLHRRKKIDDIRNRLHNKEKIIVVSTQVVEAGVDFDFDEVVRDIAPIDSIIQCAGRCNRNGDRPISEVKIKCMVDKSGKRFGGYVYGNNIINISTEILERYSEAGISECGYFDMIEEYFTKVDENKNKMAADGFIKSIQKLYFKDTSAGNMNADDNSEQYTINKFSLIKDNPNYVDVFFIINQDAQEVFDKLKEVYSQQDFNSKQELYLKIKDKVRDYTLSLPSKFAVKFDSPFIINVPLEACSDYYNVETGFKRDDDENEFFAF